MVVAVLFCCITDLLKYFSTFFKDLETFEGNFCVESYEEKYEKLIRYLEKAYDFAGTIIIVVIDYKMTDIFHWKVLLLSR